MCVSACLCMYVKYTYLVRDLLSMGFCCCSVLDCMIHRRSGQSVDMGNNMVVESPYLGHIASMLVPTRTCNWITFESTQTPPHPALVYVEYHTLHTIYIYTVHITQRSITMFYYMNLTGDSLNLHPFRNNTRVKIRE